MIFPLNTGERLDQFGHLATLARPDPGVDTARVCEGEDLMVRGLTTGDLDHIVAHQSGDLIIEVLHKISNDVIRKVTCTGLTLSSVQVNT